MITTNEAQSVLEKKAIAEQKISKVINEFHDDTGFSITEVEIKIIDIASKAGLSKIYHIKAKVVL